MRAYRLALVIVAASFAASAGHALKSYGMSVKADPTLQNGVAVFQKAGTGAVDYWCAAGEYASRKLGASNAQTLTLVRPLGAAGGPGPRASIGFQLAGQAKNGGPNVRNDVVGETRSIAQARLLCSSTRAARIDTRN